MFNRGLGGLQVGGNSCIVFATWSFCLKLAWPQRRLKLPNDIVEMM
jgi:hypothetical protein